MSDGNGKPRTRALGLHDWAKRWTAIRPSTLKLGHLGFRSLVALAPLTRSPVLGSVVRAMTMTKPGDRTQGYSLPLNVQLNASLRPTPVTLPVDLMKKAIRDASYRAAMDVCICRVGRCTKHPHDLGCIFLGAAARPCVERGIAREVTADEACALVDRAARRGLSGQSYWIEVEQYLWGVKDEDLERFLEICFCCDCCCSALNFVRKADHESRHRFHRSIGWVARVTDECTRCAACYASCPREALVPGDPHTQVAEGECGGCGICVNACPKRAIKLELVGEMKPDLRAYFEGLKLQL